MEISVTNVGMDYHAVSDEGMKLSIVYGEEKPAEDTSMNPLAIFLSALGMCVAVMLRKYIDAHEIDATEVRVTVSGDFEPGDEACENIAISVEIPGEWDDRRKAAFLKVAETCPVHHTLCTCGHVDIEIA
ncbi:MAG: OsmC family protein [Armatimonadota bacterium]